MMDKKKLIESIRYSSKYNTPCPEWVYKVISAFDEEETKLVETTFLGDWIEITGKKIHMSVRKDHIIRFEKRWDGTTSFVLEGDSVTNEHHCNMPYEEFKGNMHINLNPSYDQRKQQAFEFFNK